jgi:2'-5' RNA ligase
MRIGFFIEPKGIILKKIQFWKQLVRKNLKNQKYLNHPPHSTIAVFDLKKKIKIKLLKSSFRDFSQNSFDVKIVNSSIFYEDPITNGDTLHLKIKKNINLSKLQRKILKSFKKLDTYLEKNKKFSKKKFQKNLDMFGYPFVGKEWLPHFTIASIKSNSNKKKTIFKDFLNQSISNKIFKIKFISVWMIRGDNHKRLFKICLK